MKIMSTWRVLPGTVKEAVNQFLEGQGKPAKGVTLLGRWHNVDCSGGFALYETDNLEALFETSAVWAEVLELHSIPVIEDDQAGPVLAKVFKK